MSDPSGYTPRVAIVTGSAKGIGYSIAHRFADDGIDVVINDLPFESRKIDEVVEEIKKKGRRAIGVTADVTKEEEVKSLVERAVSELGSVDIVCDPVILFKLATKAYYYLLLNFRWSRMLVFPEVLHFLIVGIS